MRGLVLIAQLQALFKITTKKLAIKIMLKFLEYFFEEFRANVWILRCELMILQEQRLGIEKKHKYGK